MKPYSPPSHCDLTSSKWTAKYKEYDAHTASFLSANPEVLKQNAIPELLFRAVLHRKNFGEPIGFATMTTAWRGVLQLNDEKESKTQSLFTKVSTLLRFIAQFPHGEMLVAREATRAKASYSYEKCADHDLAIEIILRGHLPEADFLDGTKVKSTFMRRLVYERADLTEEEIAEDNATKFAQR